MDIFIGLNLLQNRHSNDGLKKMTEYVSGIKVCHDRGMEQKFKTITSQIPSRSRRFIFWKENSVEEILNI